MAVTLGNARPEVADTHLPQDLVTQSRGVILRSVTKRYGSVVAVDGIDLEIPAGSYCCLLGPSGCGKTSTLRMIAGHEEISAGDVVIGEERVNEIPAAKRHTAMLFQNYALFPHKSVWGNVEFGLKMQQVSKPERDQRVGEILELVGLESYAKRKPATLSGGQQQRVALARALVTRPYVLLLDEPLSALDESLRVRMRGELRKLQQQFGLTFIQVTHVQDEAFSLSDKVVVMNFGHIEQEGTPQQIFSAPASQFVAQFVGDNNIFQGQVIGSEPDGDGDLVQLEVQGLGQLFCRGAGAVVGQSAACSVRADRMGLQYEVPGHANVNHIKARVTFVEFTGYVTRVSLVDEATGMKLLYKLRTDELNTHPLQEGQPVVLTWTAEDSIFLPR